MRKYSVYVHVNKHNGKRYFGMTSQRPHRRWSKGVNAYVGNKRFTQDINAFGWDSFDHSIIAEGLSFTAACLMERGLIAEHNTTNPEKGYNKYPGSFLRHEGSYSSISRSKMGHIVPESTRAKIRSSVKKVSVDQYTPSGEYVKTYTSLTEAANSVGAFKTNIWNVCMGRKPTARGYVWRYSSSSNNAKRAEERERVKHG